MNKKILVAVDGSPNALKAVRYVAKMAISATDIKVTLLHVLPPVPPTFWDDGHILTKEEKKARGDIVTRWQKEQEKKCNGILQKLRRVLTKAGVENERIETKFVPQSEDVALDIINEVEKGKFGTLVLGRRGLSMTEQFFLGSVTNKIIQYKGKYALCIVE